MRRIFLFSFFAFSFLYINTLTAQHQIGVRTGANWNRIKAAVPFVDIDEKFNLKSIEKLNVGLVYAINFSDRLGLQTEVNYIKKGFAVTQDLGDYDLLGVEIPLETRIEAQITYVDIPILAKYKMGQKALKGYLMVGPYLGYASKGKLKAYSNSGDEVELASTDFNFSVVRYARFEIGGTAGLGATLDIGFGELFADARYNFGLTKLFDIPLLNSNNRGIGVNLGLLVNI